ncbi:MAG: DUF1847 domain-containing protein [Bacteroidota bacterium]
MNCTSCDNKVCRKQQTSCKRESFSKSEIIVQYQESSHIEIVKAAAELVDSGRAGTLSRMEEIIEFAKRMNYQKLGIAYCYGMEQQAKEIESILTDEWFEVSAVSCSVGGLKQSEVNAASCIHKVSCNPLGQAEQLNAEKVELTLVVGICLGHDILLNRNLGMDFTTLVVKDRKHNHVPLLGIEK